MATSKCHPRLIESHYSRTINLSQNMVVKISSAKAHLAIFNVNPSSAPPKSPLITDLSRIPDMACR